MASKQYTAAELSDMKQRYGCTACHYDFVAYSERPLCPSCDAPALMPIAACGPVPGKNTKLRRTGIEGKNVTLTTKITLSLLDRVEDARGDVPRAVWLRELVETRLGYCQSAVEA